MTDKKIQSVDFDRLGDIQKGLERVEAGRAIMPGIPLLARLDGRSFHSFTRSAKKPFDEQLIWCMQDTARDLLEEYKADVAYTQSDEITLAWANLNFEETQLMFGGKFQKLCSLLAARASVTFNQNAAPHFPWTRVSRPVMDCRVWQVPNLHVAAANFLWREMDATKNSVSMAASAFFSPKQLHCVPTKERIELLRKEKDIHWENYPTACKKGTYQVKRKVEVLLSKEELEWIKPEYRPSGPVLRSKVIELDIPPATKITNFKEVLFDGADPIVESEKLEVVS